MPFDGSNLHPDVRTCSEGNLQCKPMFAYVIQARHRQREIPRHKDREISRIPWNFSLPQRDLRVYLSTWRPSTVPGESFLWSIRIDGTLYWSLVLIGKASCLLRGHKCISRNSVTAMQFRGKIWKLYYQMVFNETKIQRDERIRGHR